MKKIDLILKIADTLSKQRETIFKLQYRNIKTRYYRKFDLKHYYRTLKKAKYLNDKLKKKINKQNIKHNYEIFWVKDKQFLVKKAGFNLITKIKHKWFLKPKYYILYQTASGNFEILAIYKDINEFIRNDERHVISKNIGFFRFKPLFFVHHDIIISLEIDNKKKDKELVWNAKSFYNIIEHQIRKKLTQGDRGSLTEFIKQNWLWVIGAIAVVLFVASPYGKNFMAQLMKDWKLSGG